MKAEKGMSIGELLIVLAAVAIVAVCLVKYLHPRENDGLTQGAEGNEHAERERRLREEEAFERKLREARLASEREEEEREAARLARKKAAEAAETERQRKIAEVAANRERYRGAQSCFSGEFDMAKSAPADEKPWSVATDKTFWCVFASYSRDKTIYEINAAPGGQMEVFALSADSAPQPVNSEIFASRIKSETNAITSGGKVWLSGIVSPVGKFPVPSRGNDFRILEIVLRDMYEPIVSLGAALPDTKYSVCLKSDDGKTNIDIGVIGLADTVEREKIEELIGREISRTASKGFSMVSKVKKPKKFKRTVVLYDGTYIKKEIGGVTKVPRQYVFHGTNQRTNEGWRDEREFNKKWQALYDEAIRQEKREQKIEADYAAALANERFELERKRARLASNSSSDQSIDAALAKCKLYVTIHKSPNGKVKKSWNVGVRK